jgi:hypothetical protein
VSSYLPLGPRLRRWSLGAFAAACVAEVALITVQAWRHVPSHFDMATPFDSLVARVLAAGGAALVAVIAVLTVASWRPAPEVAPSMRLAVRAGLLTLDLALAIGVVMIVIGVLDVIRGDQQAAYAVGAQWKLAHAVPMHGVLVLPLLAWFLSRVRWPERRRVQVVGLAVAGYAVLCLDAVAESVAAIDPLSAPLAGTLVAAFGVAGLGVAGLLMLAGTFRDSSRSDQAAGRAPAPVEARPAQVVERGSPR